jgi:hypothetical protein
MRLHTLELVLDFFIFVSLYCIILSYYHLFLRHGEIIIFFLPYIFKKNFHRLLPVGYYDKVDNFDTSILDKNESRLILFGYRAIVFRLIEKYCIAFDF